MTPCLTCKHRWYGDVSKALPNFKTWWCRKKRMKLGDNKQGGQMPMPDTCKEREAV